MTVYRDCDFLSLWRQGLDTKEIASWYEVHESVVYSWLARGKPPVHRLMLPKPPNEVTARKSRRVPEDLEDEYRLFTRSKQIPAHEAARMLGIEWT
jgi:transposase